MSLPIEKLRAVKRINTHKGCADGVASAIILHDALPEAEICFIQYGTDQHRDLKVVPNTLFCDLSPDPERYQAFVDAGALILDHHKGAQKLVEAFGDNGVFGDEVADPYACGASLAFREVWLKLVGNDEARDLEFVVKLAKLSAVRDTWQTKDADWAEACSLAETLRFYPEESWLIRDPFSAANKGWWEARLGTGAVLVERNARTVHAAVEGAHRFTTVKGTRVVMFSGLRLSSDAAELVDKDADLVVGFDYVGIESGVASLVYSTRSHTDFNCMLFCKAQGGGGHTKAAGFPLKFSPKSATLDPYTTFERLLTAYEASA